MAQGNNRGGQRRQQNNGGQQVQQRSENQQISYQEEMKAKMGELFAAIGRMRRAIEAVLPPYITYDKFNAIVLTAVRSDPGILVCTIDSIVTACMRAAYDGLMPDKREAVILKSRNKVPGTQNDWRDEARYQSMVAGLRKQILAGGLVSDVTTTIVYAEEQRQGLFKQVRGTNPSIDHTPLPEAERGEPIAAYAVAFFHDGRRPLFEVMFKGEIYVIRDSAQTGKVWEGPYELEMWRKTVLRRFRKSLPGGNDIIDMEAREMFPQFSGDADAAAALPSTPRPTRESVQQRQLTDEQGTEAGVSMDLGSFERVREEVEQRHDPQTGEIQRSEQAGRGKVESSEKPAENGQSSAGEKPKTAENRQDGNRSDSHPQQQSVPANDGEWETWRTDLLADLEKAKTADDINALRREVNPVLEQAPKPILDEITGRFQDAIADLMG